MRNRILAFLLSALMLVAMLPSFGAYGEGEPVDIDNPFKDLPAGSWYTESALYCYKYGYMAGTADAVFNPSGVFTRAMFVTVLYQIDFSSEKYSTSSFSDVEVGKWYASNVEWAYRNGYASGLGHGVFGPSNPVTREQLAVFLYTYTEKSGYNISARADLSRYSDKGDISAWAYEAVSWAVAEGLISGTSSTNISPKTKVTRAQVAVILKKYLANHGIEWDNGIVTVERTCTTDGVTAFISKDGTKTKYVTYKAWHTYNDGVVTKPRMCYGDGQITYTCSTCGSKKYETIPMIGKHSWDSGRITKNATCTAEGEKTLTCSVCKKTYTVAIEKTPHSWNSGVITTQPTCQAEGVKTFTCSACKGTYTKPVAKLEHDWKPATCISPKTCKKCGATTGNALGHKYNSNGICTVCGHDKNSVTIVLKNEIPFYAITGKAWFLFTNIRFDYKDGVFYYYYSGEVKHTEALNASLDYVWKLRDSDGYVVANSTNYIDLSGLSVGDKIRDRYVRYSVNLSPGETYYFEIDTELIF